MRPLGQRCKSQIVFTELLLLTLLNLLTVAPAASANAISCDGILSPSFFQPLIAGGVFIHQFEPGIVRQKGDAMCAPVAAANMAQALYYSMTGKAVYPELLIDYVNESWRALRQIEGLQNSTGLPEVVLPSLALGAAHKLKFLSHVAPMASSDELWIHDHPQELVSTRSRLRALGLRTPNGAHVVLSLGMDVSSHELLILDSNDSSRILRFQIIQSSGRLSLKSTDRRRAENVSAMHSNELLDSREFPVMSVFGLSAKEDLQSANANRY